MHRFYFETPGLKVLVQEVLRRQSKWHNRISHQTLTATLDINHLIQGVDVEVMAVFFNQSIDKGIHLMLRHS